MRVKPFSRPTLIAAVELLEGHSQARFNQMVLRLGLENEIDSGTALSVAKKCDMLGRMVVQRSGHVLDTLDGTMTLGEAVVREPIQLLSAEPRFPREVALGRGLARDGYIVGFDDYGRNPNLRAALPDEVQLPETDDEVHQLLKGFQFTTPLVILIKRSRRTRAAIGRPATASSGPSLKACLTTSSGTSGRRKPHSGPAPRIGARSWPIRASAFLRSIGEYQAFPGSSSPTNASPRSGG